MIHFARSDKDTVFPVDVHSDNEDSAQWVQRYGSPARREEQRLAVASILSVYAELTDANTSMRRAAALLAEARTAARRALELADRE